MTDADPEKCNSNAPVFINHFQVVIQAQGEFSKGWVDNGDSLQI